MTFKNAFAAIVFSFLPLTAAHAALIQVSVDPECRVDLIGVIVKGDAEAFEKLAEHLIVNNGESTSDSVVCLDSPGGSVIEGMAMAKFILERGVSTRIRAGKQCASICAIMFMMGNYQGSEVSGLSRRMHYTSQLGFHRPYLRVDEASLYTSNDLESTYDLGMETIFEILTIANQREPWGTSQMIEPELLQRITGTPGTEMFYVLTIEETMRWRIDVDGILYNNRPHSNQLHYACENALALPVALTSELNGNDSVLGQAIFGFDPLNSYSVEQIATTALVQTGQRSQVSSIRAGYSSIGCQLQVNEQSIGVCGYDGSTDVQIGDCGDEFGMRYYPNVALLHPKTQLVTLALPDDLSSDARRITRCETYDASQTLTDSQFCLQSVILIVGPDGPLARHYLTWPSGSRTVIEIGSAPYGETSNYVRVNGARGERAVFRRDANCIKNQETDNMICVLQGA